MANPNLLALSSITGHMTRQSLTTSVADAITAASNTLVKIVSVYLSNAGSTTVSATVGTYESGGVVFLPIVQAMDIPPESTVQLITKDAPLYLNEGDKLSAFASANNLRLTISYEIMS